MEQRLYELLCQCTVRISVPGKVGHGTGFFVAPGLILTCAHVVKAAQSNTSSVEVYWSGQLHPAQIIQNRDDYDLALLQVNLSDHPCVYLQEEAIPFDALYSYGYPDVYPDGDPATFTLEGKAGEQEEQLKFKTGQVRPGMSGAPLLNVRTGHVCGVVQITRDRNNDLGGRAIPITTVFRVFPELVDQQQQFHQQDRRWTNCLWEVVARTKYLECMTKRYSSVTLPIGPAQEFSLQAIFQPLKLRRDPLAAEDLVREERRALLGEPRYSDEDPRRVFPDSRRFPNLARQTPPAVIAENADDALKKSSKRSMVVLGGPGTGKTILLKYLVGDRAKQALAYPSSPLPIFISLPDLARSDKTLKEYLTSIVQGMMVDERFAQVLWKALEQGKAFVCLDSLDEVVPKLRPEKIKLINELTSSTDCTYIVGSRFTDYKGGQLKGEWFTEWELQPMSSLLREELAKRLLPELYRLMSPANLSAENNIREFVSTLEHHEQAAAWGENPLLFSLAAVVFVRTGTLPPSRAMLYQQVIDAVLETRESNQPRREMLRSVLACLALELFQEKGRTFSLSDLLRFLQIVRKRQDEQWDTEEIVLRIIDSGILEVVAHDTYGFRHQTFQEYLAAVELAQRLTRRDQAIQEEAWNLAWSKRTYSRWTEVLRLMIGELEQKPEGIGISVAQRWLHKLIQQRVAAEGDPGSLGLILALKTLCDVAKVPKCGDVKTDQMEKELVLIWIEELVNTARRGRERKRKQLASLAHEISDFNGNAVDIVLERLVAALQDRNGYVKIAAWEALGVMGTRVPLEPLITAALHADGNVLSAAVEALRAFGERVPLEPFLAVLREDQYTPNTGKEMLGGPRSAALEVLGEQGERVPLEPLMKLALHDRDWYVRRTAMKALREQGERVPLEFWFTALHDNDWYIRSVAVKTLGARGEHVPLEPLLADLDDERRHVQSAALEALGELGERVPLEPLLAALQENKEKNVRISALKALEMQGKRVPLEPLLVALHDEDWHVRQGALEALRGQGERVPLEVLPPFLHDKFVGRRLTAIEVLGAQGTKAPLELLLAALHDEDKVVRDAAAEALKVQVERISFEFIVDKLINEHWITRVAAVEVLGAQGSNAPLEPLFAALHDENEYVRAAAVKALGEQGKRVPLEVLIEALEDEDSYVRCAAVKALGAQGKRVPLERLLQVLYDEYWGVRDASMNALKMQGKRVPVDFLLAAMRDESLDIHWTTMEALKAQGKRVPLKPLLESLHDKNKDVRWIAVEVLGAQGRRAPIAPLLAALHDEEKDVRSAAVEALGAQRTLAMLQPVLAAFSDENVIVQSSAVKALGALLFQNDTVKFLRALGIRVPMNLEWLLAALQSKRSEHIRIAAVEVLGAMGKHAPLEPLLDALHDVYLDVYRAVVQVLKAQSRRISLDFLFTALQDSNGSMRAAAVDILGAQGKHAPLEPLLAALHDEYEDVRRAAVEALGGRGARVPREPLLVALYDENQYVRCAAVKALEAQGKSMPIIPIMASLGDEESRVRHAALHALKRVYPQELFAVTSEAIAILNRQPSGTILGSLTQSFIAEVIGDIGLTSPILLEKLTQLLDWSYWQVQLKAARALGKLRRNIPEAAIYRLLELSRLPDPKMQAVREAADDALAEILSLETGIEDS